MLGGAGIGGEQLVAIGVNGAEVLGEFERAFVNLEAKVTLVPRDNSGIVGGKKEIVIELDANLNKTKKNGSG